MTTVPIKDTKDTAKFSQLVRNSPGPVIVTKNGYEDYVALSMQEYDSLRYKASMSELYAQLILSEREAAEGKVTSFEDFRDEVKERYGL